MSLTEEIKNKFPKYFVAAHSDFGDETISIVREGIVEVMTYLKNHPQTPFNLMLDLCGVDYLGETPRFEVVYHLYALESHTRLRIKSRVPEEDAVVSSVIHLWPAVDWYEREAWDMLGIKFHGHPKMKRLLMWEEFEGHPLRKDYPINKRQRLPESADII
ncbi:MAG: NADH-quinone oxidoreductase subunit C [uncultured bacterium]|nr:MAG: NADH-quinone oxidoreductase subunit C [uncultured bacterium]